MKAIVSLSGGMDSATVLAVATIEREVQTVGFCYGSKHNPYENRAALALATFYNVPFRLIDLSVIMANFRSDLLASGGDVPEGHYEEESMRRTVVPGRNIIFSSILAGIAMSEGAGEVWLGIHAGDHFIYPDCRPAFADAMDKAVVEGTGGLVRLQTPFLYDTKVGILRRGFALERPVPYQLTRTCYKAQELACGKCGSCRERLHAFQQIGRADPVEYEYRHPNPGEGK